MKCQGLLGSIALQVLCVCLTVYCWLTECILLSPALSSLQLRSKSGPISLPLSCFDTTYRAVSSLLALVSMPEKRLRQLKVGDVRMILVFVTYSDAHNDRGCDVRVVMKGRGGGGLSEF